MLNPAAGSIITDKFSFFAFPFFVCAFFGKHLKPGFNTAFAGHQTEKFVSNGL